jgi:hypothetical protein
VRKSLDSGLTKWGMAVGRSVTGSDATHARSVWRSVGTLAGSLSDDRAWSKRFCVFSTSTSHGRFRQTVPRRA